MKQIKFLSLILAALLLAGCGNDEPTAEPIDPADAVITITTSAFSIDNAAGSKTTATFTVNADWTISVSYEGDAQGWLSVMPQSGSAGEDIVITLKAIIKNASDANRIAYVNIRYANKTHRLKITQTIDPNIDITARFDAEFAKILKERGYIPNAENIKFSDVKDIKKVDVSNSSQRGNLTTLAGIEYFSALNTLNCRLNELTDLDVNKNMALTYLNCDFNQLTALDVSKNTALTYLSCTFNQLTALDVSNNTALTFLSCSGNQLAALDVSKNTALTGLGCCNNKLTALDISKNTALTDLACYDNLLTALDVGKNMALNSLHCFDNQLTALDVSKNTALTDLRCSNNLLTTLDISKNTALTFLHCSGNQLTALDVSKNTALNDLYCYDNQLTALDISKNTALKWLYCDRNPGNGTVFPVTAWFDNSSVPNGFTTGSWDYNGNTISIDYIKEN